MDAGAIEVKGADALLKHLDFLRTSAQEEVEKALEGMDMADRRLFASAAAILALGGAATYSKAAQAIEQAPKGHIEQPISDSAEYAASAERLNVEGKIELAGHNEHGITGTLQMKPLDSGRFFSVDISDVQVPDAAIDDLLDPNKPFNLFDGYDVDEGTVKEFSAKWRDLARDVAATRAAYRAVVAESSALGAHARSIVSAQSELMAMVDQQLGVGEIEAKEQSSGEPNAIEDAVARAAEKAKEQKQTKPEKPQEPEEPSEPNESDEEKQRQQAIQRARENAIAAVAAREPLPELQNDAKIEAHQRYYFNEDGLRGSAEVWEDPDTGELQLNLDHVSVTDPQKGYRFVHKDAERMLADQYESDEAMTELALELLRKDAARRAAYELLLKNAHKAGPERERHISAKLKEDIRQADQAIKERFGQAYVGS